LGQPPRFEEFSATILFAVEAFGPGADKEVTLKHTFSYRIPFIATLVIVMHVLSGIGARILPELRAPHSDSF
jgi:hypothetical protein